MAGFAVVMTFITWGFIFSVLALIASILLYGKARYITSEKSSVVRRFRLYSVAIPFLCVGWIPVTLILHTFISNRIAQQSVGFSPDPYVTLPNGYVLGSLNTYSGYIRAPHVHTDVAWVGTGYVRGIIDIELKDGRFEGTYLDSHSDFQPGGTDGIRRFVFDTRDQSIKAFSTDTKADFTDQQNMVHADQDSYWAMYATYRHRWPTVVFWIILIAGEAMIIRSFLRARAAALN